MIAASHPRSTVLITGGAGFIGSHLADVLIRGGYRVILFDNLTPEVHGVGGNVPAYLKCEATVVRGDGRDRESLLEVVRIADIVLHLAALTGPGKEMPQSARYLQINVLGPDNLLDILVNDTHHVRTLVLASSRAVYGEGQYICDKCGIVYPDARSRQRLERARWEIGCPHCGKAVIPTPTPEDKPLKPVSIYGVSKRDQEEMCLSIGNATGIPIVVLRYFNVYGPRQSMSNPYTGIITTFVSHLLRGQPPEIYEDGLESRDFVHVRDAVRTTVLAMESNLGDGEIINVGTGRSLSILDVATMLARKMKSNHVPEISGKFRVGDIRHCHADVTKAQTILGFNAKIEFEEGIEDFLRWAYAEATA